MVSSLVFVSSHRGLAAFFIRQQRSNGGVFSPFQHPSLCADTNCRLRFFWGGGGELHGGDPEASTQAHWPPRLISLSLHWILMWGWIPVRVARHVAVGRHVYSFGRDRDVPYWGNGRGARGEGHGTRYRIGLVRVAALLEQLLELWPLILEPNLYLQEERRGGACS